MMNRHLSIAGLLLLIAVSMTACTNSGQPLPYNSNLSGSYNALTPVAEVQVNGQTTTIESMFVSNGSLYLSGKPFAFARWDISADPTNPRPLYTASNDLVDFSPDPPFGGWSPDGFATSVMAVMGNYAYMSGDLGTSVIQVGPSSGIAQEVFRAPGLDANGNLQANAAFEYAALVADPSQQYLYGLTVEDGYYILNATQAPTLSLTINAPTAYLPNSTSTVCCVTGAAALGNHLFVSLRSQLVIYTMNGGSLSYLGSYTGLQPTNLAATAQNLYIQNNATATSTSQSGIFVMNASGNIINQLLINPVLFAVSPNDQYLYTYEGDGYVKIYSIAQ